MIDVFGTLGPACDDETVLSDMFVNGMTGIRVNLSHIMLSDCSDSIEKVKRAAAKCGTTPKILIDMQGPELRIGRFIGKIELEAGQSVKIGREGIPLESIIAERFEAGDELLLDDGKILAEVTAKEKHGAVIRIIRGGELSQRKSILVKGKDIRLPALSEEDLENLKVAGNYGITGIMQPFVRCKEDLEEVKTALDECGCNELRIYAKIENRAGMENLRSFIDLCDEVIIARGDLGNSMPLWELPRAQKQISKICNEYKKPFMVVTQMLASMEKSLVPTRAEVSDIYNAVLDGASSVMVTGETAVGVNPAEVIRYLSNTVYQAVKYGIL